ncbi:uncharacterized protein LOC143014637 [Genypterus blacodes]|uniref:uncharacterized protein LOC143014637 n=1 Tax=Genypterus blacodes TaxID=154954 RepID=UPI003F76303C
MAEDQSCEPPPPPRGNTQAKKMSTKKKRRKKNTEPSFAHTHTVKPQTASLPPETTSVPPLPPPCPDQPRHHQLSKLRAGSSRKNGGRAGSKKRPKDSPANKSPGAESLAAGGAPELSAQARESLRWEGVLEDPQAEERRMEAYRANRRQRYLAHREALIQEMQTALRKDVS